MRLFLAIELPSDVRDHLGRVQEALKPVASKASWTRVENLHLTLKFLGEVSDADAAQVCEKLKCVAVGAPIELCAAGIECFPLRGPVRVIGAAMTGDVERLGELHAQIEEACAASGFAREPRAYRPHATLARARVPMPGSSRDRMSERTRQLWPGPRMEATEFVLMHSQLHPKGSRYTPVARFGIW